MLHEHSHKVCVWASSVIGIRNGHKSVAANSHRAAFITDQPAPATCTGSAASCVLAKRNRAGARNHDDAWLAGMCTCAGDEGIVDSAHILAFDNLAR